MFGLEKKKKGLNFLVFDLEKRIQKKDENKKLLDHSQSMISEIKKLLRSGTDSKDFENLGIMLHAYSALSKLLNTKQEA